MRESFGASTSGLCGLAVVALCVASCAERHLPPPPREIPPRQLIVTDGRTALRANAYVELHLWLAASAKTDAALDPELEPAKRAYKRSLANDDDDALLDRTSRALSACEDDRCAIAAVMPTGFGHAYERALPIFVARDWTERATAAWVGIEAAHATLGPEAEAIFMRTATELGVEWPDHAVPIDFVSETPTPSRAALLPRALATRGPCFVREPRADERLRSARILDCMLVRALLDETASSPVRRVLVRELGAREGERAWSLLVVHAAWAIIAGWEPKHVSVDRRAATAIEEASLAWLAREWRGSRAEPLEAFATRFVARWRTARPNAP